MTKYKSLFAALEPLTAADGKRGSLVRCTATLRDLGFIWWSADGAQKVSWHFRTGTTGGVRTTERNAVQALRDISNAASNSGVLPFGPEDADAPAPRTASAPRPSVAPAPARTAAPAAPKVPQRIVWNDAAPALDIASRLAAGLKRGTR